MGDSSDGHMEDLPIIIEDNKSVSEEDARTTKPKLPSSSPKRKREEYVHVRLGSDMRHFYTISKNHLERSPNFEQVARPYVDKEWGQCFELRRDPKLFPAVVTFLQTGAISVPTGCSYRDVQAELDFFKLRKRDPEDPTHVWTHDRTEVTLALEQDISDVQNGQRVYVLREDGNKLWKDGLWSVDFMLSDHLPLQISDVTNERQAMTRFIEFLKNNGWKVTQRFQEVNAKDVEAAKRGMLPPQITLEPEERVRLER